MPIQLLLVISALVVVVAKVTVTLHEREVCHKGIRTAAGRLCHAYASPKPKESASGVPLEEGAFGSLDAACGKYTWNVSNKDNQWGSCVNITEGVDSTDGQQYRYVTSNSVPPYYFNPYCPFGLASTCSANTTEQYCGGYCINGEPCPFPDLKCGVSQSQGFTALGDVWVAQSAYTKVPYEGNPTRSDRPGDMYEAVDQGSKTVMATTAVHLNGNSIQGPNDAGAINVDVAGFMLMCGGHVTPPVVTGAMAGQPMYHYHKAPDCTPQFLERSVPLDHNGTAQKHGTLFGYALDGFGLYGYEDVGGAMPVLDECGGHFGPVDDAKLEEVVYHYHATTYSPYHLACQGPALGKCADTQHGADFCGEGCGAEVCVQPGTKEVHLQQYVAKWNSTWLEKYTTNLQSGSHDTNLQGSPRKRTADVLV